jgi:uncharacterized membrane protein
MLRTFFLISGTAACLLFGYASMIGWNIMDFNNYGRMGPHAPNVYHK